MIIIIFSLSHYHILHMLFLLSVSFCIVMFFFVVTTFVVVILIIILILIIITVIVVVIISVIIIIIIIMIIVVDVLLLWLFDVLSIVFDLIHSTRIIHPSTESRDCANGSPPTLQHLAFLIFLRSSNFAMRWWKNSVLVVIIIIVVSASRKLSLASAL